MRVERAAGDSVVLTYESGTGRLQTLGQRRGTNSFGYNASTGTLSSIAAGADTVTVSYGYNGPLRVSQTWTGQLPGGGTKSVAHGYNAEFLPATETVNGSNQANFSYDQDGLLIAAGDLTVHRIAATGQVDSTSVGSVNQSLDYDAHGDLQNLRYVYGSAVLLQQSLKRDLLGRIVEVAESGFVPTRTWGYRYDLAGRLYGVTLNGDTLRTYRYDDNGNRTEERNGAGDTLATATDDAQDRLIRYGATGFTYTASGELLWKALGNDTTRYAYDALGNLVRATLPGDTVVYKADGENRRVGRQENGPWTGGFLYRNGLNHALEYRDHIAIKERDHAHYGKNFRTAWHPVEVASGEEITLPHFHSRTGGRGIGLHRPWQ